MLFIKMANVLWHVILFLYFFNITLAEGQQNANGGIVNRRPVLDPVSNMFSEVGNLFLDIDETFSRQTAPKVSFEDRISEQVFGDRRTPLSEYFAQIQRNYRNLQNRIGPAVAKGLAGLLSGTNEYRVNIEERNGNTFIDASLPPIPLRLFSESNSPNRDEETEIADTSSESKKHASETHGTKDKDIGIAEEIEPPNVSRSPFAKYDHERKAKPAIKDNRKSERVLPEIVQRRMDNLVQSAKHTNELLLSLDQKAIEESTTIIPRSASPPKNENTGRIMGDSLYSESTYNDYIRNLLKTHGKWLLDSPLLALKGPLKKSSKDSPQSIQNAEIISSSDSTSDPHRTGLVNEITSETSTPNFIDSSSTPISEPSQEIQSNEIPKDSVSAYYYDLTKDFSGDRQEILDIIMHSVPKKSTQAFSEIAEIGEKGDSPNESVILAFTPDGVPMKLRMGPEIENPMKFLHKTLRTAGVSLNIPVKSYDDIQPVGREILQLGSSSGGIVARALYLDLSDSYNLKSLLRVLKKSRRNQKGLI